jgi:capsule polysaccharide export protein KpsE/RkpR
MNEVERIQIQMFKESLARMRKTGEVEHQIALLKLETARIENQTQQRVLEIVKQQDKLSEMPKIPKGPAS